MGTGANRDAIIDLLGAVDTAAAFEAMHRNCTNGNRHPDMLQHRQCLGQAEMREGLDRASQ